MSDVELENEKFRLGDLFLILSTSQKLQLGFENENAFLSFHFKRLTG